jgi:outer membrane lipoprotein SlyB
MKRVLPIIRWGDDMVSSRLLMWTLLTLSTAGCAVQQPTSSTQGTTLVQTGQVISMRDVTAGGSQSSGIGTIAGSVLGGFFGSKIGAGSGSTVAGIGGAIAGGVAGQHVERAAGTKTITELVVRLDNGDVRTYNVDPGEPFQVGDQVKVTTRNGTSMVTR